MIIAYTKRTARNLSDMFAKREIKKTYVAIVKEKFPSSTITLDERIDKKDALSFATSIAHNHNKSLLEINIKTGRKHQIKKH
ncbi:RNA pseudouridine synthase [Candidatus Ruthia endofausta]|uniref:RNA pseudouridine synthase n=1 Tax=Candidatus Ruthia endofausta TaxID=2738852 RepID=A0A6N0HNJ6_9GAMM|nr:pseudouridine synthase [Candidatus Ruthia endofausta]QKQ23883.1 RNA pseudouridine synthase [Candidatus Ruthia endofausta]